MAVAFVSEYASLATDAAGNAVATGQEPAIAVQTLSIGGTSVASSAFNDLTRFVLIHTDAICHVRFDRAYRSMAFTSGGTAAVAAGDTITGATSSATAFIREVRLTSGSWAGGDAAGFLIFKSTDKTGTFQSENVNTASQNNIATVVVDVAAPVATSSYSRMAAGETRFYGVSPGDAVAVITGV